MSRIGLKTIEIPEGVEVNVEEQSVSVKGPKGEVQTEYNPLIEIQKDNNTTTVSRPNDHKEHRSLHGTTRSLIANMIEGVSKGFQKELEIIGVGYRAQKQGTKIVINAGYSHPVE